MNITARGAGRWFRLATVGRALRNRNYQLFFFGQGTSLIGTWMQRVALSWLVYRLTGSEFLLGVVGFSSQILTFLVAPFAGVLADRMDRRRLIIATQTLAMLQAFVLAALTFTGVVTVWHLIVLSTLLGLVNSFDIPVRQSFVVEMLDSRADLPNALALNSFLVNATRMVGPSLAGFLIGLVGEGICFLLNGITFVAVIAALAAMKVRPALRNARNGRVLHNLREGLAYTAGSPPIRSILLLLATFSLLGMPYSVLMPVFAKDILRGGPETLGFLMAATGVGALAGALFLASRKSVQGHARVMTLAVILFGTAVIAFSLSRTIWLSLALLVGVGFGAMLQLVASNTLLQTIVDDDKRGRVMSFYTVCFMGMGPFGSLLAGGVASRFGAPWALAIGGAGVILAAAVFSSRLSAIVQAVQRVLAREPSVPARLPEAPPAPLPPVA